MRLNDLILFAVIFSSIALAILAPQLGRLFDPFLIYFMMSLLFLSFLRIDFTALVTISRKGLARLIMLTIMKLAVLPIGIYYVFDYLLPEFALPALLISGISTGVVAPFIAGLISADLVIVFRLVVITSILAPFTLPLLVQLLLGEQITIPIFDMIALLSKVVFVPMALVIFLRRFYPVVLDRILKVQFPTSLLLFALINLGIFSKYSHYFLQNPGGILIALIIAYVLAILYYFVGYIIMPGRSINERLAAGVSFAAMNNVLVIMFASQFFGPLAPTLAALYMFPYYTMIPPVKFIAQRFGGAKF